MCYARLVNSFARIVRVCGLGKCERPDQLAHGIP